MSPDLIKDREHQLDDRIAEAAMTSGTAAPLKSQFDPAALDEATLSSELVTMFRGKFCDILMAGRSPDHFKEEDVLYDIGDPNRRLYFIQRGFVKVGTLTPSGREIIFDIRKAGDVVGELCVAPGPLRDRAVALELTEAVRVPYSEMMKTLRNHPDLSVRLVEIFCEYLADAYNQITAVTVHDLTERVVQALLKLAPKLGRPSGDRVQIAAYLTQEEISQMVGARRERVSIVLNSLRRRGLVDYSSRGHLVLNVTALQKLSV
jgi:CRP/FNR family transcriptional regulator, cyclic AMP receptor protein